MQSREESQHCRLEDPPITDTVHEEYDSRPLSHERVKCRQGGPSIVNSMREEYDIRQPYEGNTEGYDGGGGAAAAPGGQKRRLESPPTIYARGKKCCGRRHLESASIADILREEYETGLADLPHGYSPYFDDSLSELLLAPDEYLRTWIFLVRDGRERLSREKVVDNVAHGWHRRSPSGNDGEVGSLSMLPRGLGYVVQDYNKDQPGGRVPCGRIFSPSYIRDVPAMSPPGASPPLGSASWHLEPEDARSCVHAYGRDGSEDTGGVREDIARTENLARQVDRLVTTAETPEQELFQPRQRLCHSL